MAIAKITKAMIERPTVPPKPGQLLTTWDDSPGLNGFGIRVAHSRRVSFVVRFWTGSRERWQTLGAHPRLTLTEARKKAKKVLRSAGDGVDPIEEARKAKRDRRAAEARTVATLAAEWLAELPNKTTRKGARISPRTVEMYESCMRVHIVPALGNLPVSQVKKRDVKKLHAKASRSGNYTANRAVSVLSIFYNWLNDIEEVEDGCNPARRPPRNPEQRRGEHASVRLSPEQEARLVRAIYSLIDGTATRTNKRGKTQKHSDPVGGVALLTLLDTGRRKSEILGLEWKRLDLDGQTADLGKTKGKAAGDTVYLTPRVCDAIRSLPRIVGNPFVFTGRGAGGRRSGLQSAWEGVKADAALESLSPELAGFRLHDLRHHRISESLAAGIAPQLVIRQSGHTSFEQLKTYGHIEVADVAAALSRLTPVEPAANAEVVEIGSATPT